MTSSTDPRSSDAEELFVPSGIGLSPVGECLGRGVLPGLLLLLSGPMGSGKTSLASGLARGMGIAVRIASPTFLYLQSYHASGSPPALPLLHADWDRVSPGAEDLEEALVEGASERVTIVEWGEKLPDSVVAIFPLRVRLTLSIPENREGRRVRILWDPESGREEALARVRTNFRHCLQTELPSLVSPSEQ